MANGLLSNSNGSNTDILTVTVFGGVNHDSTLSGNGTSGSPLGVVNPDDTEVNSYVHNNSATIDDINEVVQSNSAQWSTEFDPTFMSGAIDNKLDSSSFVPSDFYPMTGNPSGFLTEHQSLAGYATEQWVEDKGYITGVDLTPYQEKSGMVDYQTTAGMTAYATTSDVANKLDTTAFSNVSGTFLTAHQTIPSAKWETASDVVQSNSAQWSENTGDEEVNNAVYNNSAKWNEISVYESNSSTYLTAHQSLDGYATQDWVTGQGYITGVDLSDYAKTSAVHNDIDSAVSGKLDTTAFSNVSGNFLTAHQDISYKLDATAFSDVSGTFLTSINIPESANWNETTSVVESNSAAWGNEFDPSYMSGAIDNKLNTSSFADVSGTFLTAHQSLDGYATTAWVEEQGYLTAHQDISNKLDVSSFADLSGSFLTAINIPESASWNEATTAYQNASGSYLTAISIPESSTWNDVASTYQTNSSTYLTAHQSLDGYATTSELNSTSSYLSGAIDYVSANAGGSPSGFVSGSNVLFVPYGEWNPSEGNVYSANISGDITVSTGFYTNSGEYISIGHTYSLSAIGSQIGNKLNKNVIEDSNTLSLINDKAEVYSFAYKPSEIITTGISMDNYSNQGEVRIHTRVDSPYSFYSATLVIASNGFDYESIPNGWNFVNSANGSATFSKYYKAETYYDDIYFRNFWSYNLTNASAYAVACGPELVTDELAFKSDLTGGLSGDYVSGVNWVSAQQGAGPFTSIQCYEATVSGDVKVTTSAVNGLNAITYSLADIGLNLRGNSAGWNQVYNKLDTTAFDTISGDWNEAITAYQTNSSTYLTAVDLSDYVPVSSYNELKASYDTLSSLFATYSGQWLLPNTGV